MADKMTTEKQALYRETIYRKYLTPDERKQRILVAGKRLGYNNVSEIAKAMGCNWRTCHNMMVRENVSVISLYRLAMLLDVPMHYLTER